MADIDRVAFANAVADALGQQRLSFDRAAEKWTTLNKAMLSRACREIPISAGNYLLICEVLKLDPYEFLNREKGRQQRLREIVKRLAAQSVTDVEKRETGEGKSCSAK